MATIFDTARYILKRQGWLTAMQLQKLAFYSQAYSLTQNGKKLFDEDFQAWVGGPVSKPLFLAHKGLFTVTEEDIDGNVDALTQAEKNAIDAVCNKLGDLNGQELSDRTHSEDPWKNARAGLEPTQASSTVISKEAMRSYYTNNPVLD